MCVLQDEVFSMGCGVAGSLMCALQDEVFSLGCGAAGSLWQAAVLDFIQNEKWLKNGGNWKDLMLDMQDTFLCCLNLTPDLEYIPGSRFEFKINAVIWGPGVYLSCKCLFEIDILNKDWVS